MIGSCVYTPPDTRIRPGLRPVENHLFPRNACFGPILNVPKIEKVTVNGIRITKIPAYTQITVQGSFSYDEQSGTLIIHKPAYDRIWNDIYVSYLKLLEHTNTSRFISYIL